MKRLLLPLLAGLALPTAANAESYWLLIGVGKNSYGGATLEKIEMKSLATCESEGKKLTDRNNPSTKSFRDNFIDNLRYYCVIGK